MERIGIFGGTYNPPHVGHLNIVKSFFEEYELDRILIIPTYIPPHKETPDLASGEDRIEMCKRTFKDDFFTVSDMEINRKGKSYTEDTLKMLKGLYKKSELFFLVGDDMLTTLHEWRRPNAILDMCTLVAAVRSDSTTVDDLKRYATEHFPNEYEAGKIQFLYTDPLELSSTEIRERIKSSEPFNQLVTPETYEYIISRGLYSAGTQE